VQGVLAVETWGETAERLARELKALHAEREGIDQSRRWSDLTNKIRQKRYEIELHLAAVE
jgi:hypothetical protein